MTIPTLPYLAQILTGYHLRFSTKVIVPGFVGLIVISVNCELEKYSHQIPWGILALGVVQVMIFLGWLVPDPDRIKIPNGKDPNVT